MKINFVIKNEEYLGMFENILFSKWSLLNYLIVSKICPKTDPQN